MFEGTKFAEPSWDRALRIYPSLEQEATIRLPPPGGTAGFYQSGRIADDAKKDP
jgi:hypothetical protein